MARAGKQGVVGVTWRVLLGAMLALLWVAGCLTVPDEIRREFVPEINPARLPAAASCEESRGEDCAPAPDTSEKDVAADADDSAEF